MLTQVRPTPKVTTKTSGLPKCAQDRLVKIKMMVDDAEAARANLMKRISPLRPDQSVERAALEKRRIENDKLLAYARGLANRVDDFIRASGILHHVSPTPVTEAPPLIRVEEPQWGTIEIFRRKMAHIRQEMIDVRRAPLPFAQVEAALKTVVSGWAMEGRPNITIDDVKGRVEVNFGIHTPKPHKISAWLNPVGMLERLTRQAREQFENKKEPLTAEQKAERLKDLEEALYETERREIAMVDAFIERGESGVQHRLDVDPAALLGIRIPRWALIKPEGWN